MQCYLLSHYYKKAGWACMVCYFFDRATFTFWYNPVFVRPHITIRRSTRCYIIWKHGRILWGRSSWTVRSRSRNVHEKWSIVRILCTILNEFNCLVSNTISEVVICVVVRMLFFFSLIGYRVVIKTTVPKKSIIIFKFGVNLKASLYLPISN